MNPKSLSSPDTGLDTSASSYYVDDDFYERLVAEQTEWDRESLLADAKTRQECEELLYREARLLDDGRLEDWLEMFTPDCLYWVPMMPGGGDPREEVSIAFDDRRRLEDRVYWLQTGYVWSQIPPSRTRRLVGNIEAFRGRSDDEIRVRSNFVVFEARPGIGRTLAGWYGHRLRRVDGRLRIVLKQVNLVDSEQAHQNMTIVF